MKKIVTAFKRSRNIVLTIANLMGYIGVVTALSYGISCMYIAILLIADAPITTDNVKLLIEWSISQPITWIFLFAVFFTLCRMVAWMDIDNFKLKPKENPTKIGNEAV